MPEMFCHSFSLQISWSFEKIILEMGKTDPEVKVGEFRWGCEWWGNEAEVSTETLQLGKPHLSIYLSIMMEIMCFRRDLPNKKICRKWTAAPCFSSLAQSDKKELRRRSALCRVSRTVPGEATTPAEGGLRVLLTIEVLLYRFSRISEKSHSQLCLCSRMTSNLLSHL